MTDAQRKTLESLITKKIECTDCRELGIFEGCLERQEMSCGEYIRGWLRDGKTGEKEAPRSGKKKKVYISGQITGLDEAEHRRLFKTAEYTLRMSGYEPVNPDEPIDGEDTEGFALSDWMRRDIRLLCGCDYICMLGNWRKSRGARIERMVAEILGIGRISPHGEILG